MEKDTLEKSSKKNNNVLIVILILIILGMGAYILYDHGVIFSNSNITEKGNNDGKNNNKTDTDDNDKDDSTNNGVKDLDITKCLNNSSLTYSNASSVEGKYGLSMVINSDKKSVTLNIDWSVFGPLVPKYPGGGSTTSGVENFQVTGFTKDVVATFVGDLGQSSEGITLFYLMSDGTVEYTPMFAKKTDSQNNVYYVVNYVYSGTNTSFVTSGAVSGVSGVIKLYNADVGSNGASGWKTTIGATKDGSFYDLGTVINK